MKTNEFELIERLKKRIPRKLQGLIPIGDDDAGGLKIREGESLFVSTDSIVEGIDFEMKKARPELVGRKALAINLSDMAAMAARPRGFVIALGIPPSMKESWLDQFYSGMMLLAARHQVACLGGDISRASEFSAAVTVFGESSSGKVILRSGARPGDLLAVTGCLGGSILRHQFLFEPRVREALFLANYFKVHAMIDLSDGLVQDLGHLLKASGVGASVDLARVPVSQDAVKWSHGKKEEALTCALSDGEDFELLFTVSASEQKKLDVAWRKKFPSVRLSWIGRVTARKKELVWTRGAKPADLPKLSEKGYRHF